MIRFSAILVAGALAVLVAGVLATSLALVYLSIGVSVLALVLLAIGLILQRREIFGETGAAAVGGQPAWPVTPATGTPVMVGGRARIPEPGLSPEEAGQRPAEAEAGSGNGSSGGQAGRDVAAEIHWAWQEQEGSPEVGPARAPQARNGPGRNGTGQDGPAKGGPARPARTGGYSGDARLRAGATADRAARPAPASSAAGGHGTPRRRGAGGQRRRRLRARGTRPDQPGRGTRPDQRAAGTAPPGRGAGSPGRPPVGAGPPEWPVAGITWQEPADARRPSREPDTREPDGGWVFTPPTPPPPDVPASPAEEPDVPAPAAGGPEADITQQETAHDQWPPRGPEDRAAAPPTPPDRPLSPSGPDRPASPKDDFWDRVNDELAADAQREPDTPPRAASAGPPPPAAGGDLWSRPATGARTRSPAPVPVPVTQVRAGPGQATAGTPGRRAFPAGRVPRRRMTRSSRGTALTRGRPARGQRQGRWAPCSPGVTPRPTTPGTAGTGREPGAPDKEPAADGKEPAGASREPAGAGKETADVEKEADVKAEEADEEEEAAPSPWSIPLTLVGDVSDLDEEDDGQPAGPGAVEGHGTGKPPEAGEKPAPERMGFGYLDPPLVGQGRGAAGRAGQG